ncbi:hypothetical protein GWI33_022045 [Rhynchophorus ferrugineus]|uniref:Uncharacterized protein n=1 Tax=Rhynchophorus ferrugineus TaxID=354439 RepID=A0A834IR55_RHYFE|nr:hypothetical protein GWI33_022045 [Rhynchophorus ferrugineus]
MIKELFVLGIFLIAFSNSHPVEKGEPKLALGGAVAVSEDGAPAESDDLSPEASAYPGYGRGHCCGHKPHKHWG